MKKKKESEEENCQNFILEKDGKETEIISCENEPKKPEDEQVKKQKT